MFYNVRIIMECCDISLMWWHEGEWLTASFKCLHNLDLTIAHPCSPQGQTNKGQAMKVTDDNGWLMLALEPFSGSTTTYTGSEFAGTCLSDPSKCENGLTVALWLKLCKLAFNQCLHHS